jgi:acetyl esterase/lipase
MIAEQFPQLCPQEGTQSAARTEYSLSEKSFIVSDLPHHYCIHAAIRNMADFSIYGHPSTEWQALAPTLPIPPADMSVEELVRVTNAGRDTTSASEMESQGHNRTVTITNHSIPTRDNSSVEARCYRPSSIDASTKLPCYVNLHGGGFLFGTIDSEDASCSRIVSTLTAQGLPIAVLNINYRHTPAHRFPIAWEDTEDGLVWLASYAAKQLHIDTSALVIGGISAGGSLAASMALQQHLGMGPLATAEKGGAFPHKLRGQVLMIPSLLHASSYPELVRELASPDVHSYVTQAEAPILPVTRIELFQKLLYGDGPLPEKLDRRANMGAAGAEEVMGLGPVVFGIAGADPLRDEALLYAKKLAAVGVPTDVTVFPGVPHGHRRFGEGLPQASRRWDEVVTNGIRWVLSDPTAGGFEIKT